MSQNRVIQNAGIHHIGVQARDWEVSRHFYEHLLGMPFVTEFETATERFAFFDIGNGTYIELFHPMPNTPKPNTPAANDPVTHFALTTTNLAQVVARVREAGYNITEEPFAIVIGTWDATIAFFGGPNGESIELFQLNNTL
jgi:glyoxylase I family protein